MNRLPPFILLVLCFISIEAISQDDKTNHHPSLRLFAGFMNYQGDLNPNSFSISHSRVALGVSIIQPINRWLSLRGGFTFGKVEAADRYNRDYLKSRNLSFFSGISELHAAMEVNFVDLEKGRISPYIFAGVALFHFNPWTFDNAGNKVFLKPLSTEGQGLSEYPSQKPYQLTQISIPYGVGLRYKLGNALIIGLEFSQRKTFTDYLDDVSSFYVDKEILLSNKGAQAIQLGYRGASAYPSAGEQRGTPTENDWYYSAGITLESKLNAILTLFGIAARPKWKCPVL